MTSMTRRLVLGLALGTAPLLAAAQPARRRGPGDGFGPDFDGLPQDMRERVRNGFRIGSPDLDDDAIRRRWNGMTPSQRAETLQARERERERMLALERERQRERQRMLERDRRHMQGPGGGGRR